MFHQVKHIKSIITISFIVLMSLCIFGIVLIYLELIKFSEVSNIQSERKELVVVSNTLAALYRAEGSGNLLMSETLPGIRQEYDSLMNEVYFQIDSLRLISEDSILHADLDSIVILLNRKQENTFRMYQLMDSVNKKTINPIIRTRVLTQRDTDNIDKFLKKSLQLNEDTVTVKSDKKSFFQRVKDVFNSQAQDSSIVISKNHIQNLDSVYVPAITDTIVEYINEIVYENNRRNNVFIDRLAKRQSTMHLTNEELTVQINKILHDIERREYEASLNLLEEKEITLKRSSHIAYIISLCALALTIIFLIVIFRALTYNQRYRNELEKSKRYTENLLSVRERLMLTISHDIKAPISSIIGYNELLLNSKLPVREKYYVENMQLSAEHVLELVKNLLDYHTLESDKQEINLMSFNPCILIRDICQSFLPQADKNKLVLKFYCGKEISGTYKSDPYRIRQIINNLLSNAVKFTPSGGKVNVDVSIVKERNTDVLRLSVKDTGKGISKENQELIFQEFQRLDNVKNIEGSGLGLAITRKLVSLLEGKISLISEENKGSEFIVEIPILKVEDDLPSISEENKSRNDSVLSIDPEKKVLFIDDDIVQLNLFSELLKRKGYIPIICSNSIEALDIIQKTPLDMIFTDIQMPDMNGFELVERIRMATFKGAKTIPVIALSASSNISEQKYVEAGFSGFLPKPFTSDQLMDIILLYVGDDNVCVPIRNKKEVRGFDALITFAAEDKDAAQEIIHSFIDEFNKNIIILRESIDINNWDQVKKVCHKMLPLIRMIHKNNVVYLLCEFEKGVQDKEKGEELIIALTNVIEEARNFLSGIK